MLGWSPQACSPTLALLCALDSVHLWSHLGVAIGKDAYRHLNQELKDQALPFSEPHPLPPTLTFFPELKSSSESTETGASSVCLLLLMTLQT